MYVHTLPNIVYALDLNEDGKILWKYEPKQDPSVIPVMCCDTVYRGLAYADGTIYHHQANTTLVALDAKTGKEKWKVVNGDPKKGETNTATVLPGSTRSSSAFPVPNSACGVTSLPMTPKPASSCGALTRWVLTARYCLIPTERCRWASPSRRLLAQDLERRSVEDRRRYGLGLVLV